MTRKLSSWCTALIVSALAACGSDDETHEIGGSAGQSTGGSTAGSGGAGGSSAGSAGASGSAGRAGASSGGAAGTTAADAGGKAGSDAGASDSARDAIADTNSIDVNVDAATGCGAANVVTKAFFDSIFPVASRHAVYTYEGFIAASMSYPAFLNTGNLESCRKEAAAFLANVARETGRLRYAEEIAKSALCSTRTGCVCDATTTDQSKWYYGRGAIQLSWNYNYCAAGTALGADLLTQPARVATDPEFAWSTALWFWMTSQSAGSVTCHGAITGTGIFGDTIRVINGGECAMGGYNSVAAVKERVDAYIEFAKSLGIANPGMPIDLDC